MTPWTWWAGEIDDDTYGLAEAATREAAIREASQGLKPGDKFRIVEARASTAAQHEGSDCVPFLRTRNHEIITVGPVEVSPSPKPQTTGPTTPQLWAECGYCKEAGEEECLHPVEDLRWNGEQWCCEECGSGEEADLWQAAPRIAIPPCQPHTSGRWRVFEDTTRGYWGIELEAASNDDDAILYPQKIHRDTVARIVEAHNAALATTDGDPEPGEHQEVLDAIAAHNSGEEQ